jgi:sulfur relay (sulfurtransferase) complex TusBCD TusD component (DsrE family)
VTASTSGAKDAGHCPAAAGAMAAGSSCKGAASASAKTTASHCEGEGLVKMADQSLHSDCDGCSDMAHCEQEIMSAGGHVQVVQLKNGVMYMYTAESSAGVRAVQAAVTHRNERLAALTTAGDRVHLCDECKSMRGAAASGKLTREVVNIEGGCLTLVTSTDPSIVSKLHAMAQAAGARSKI